MADQVVQINTDGTGKKIDVSEVPVGSNTVERQRVVIGDDVDGTQRVRVAGLALRVNEATLQDLLLSLLFEVQEIKELLMKIA